MRKAYNSDLLKHLKTLKEFSRIFMILKILKSYNFVTFTKTGFYDKIELFDS